MPVHFSGTSMSCLGLMFAAWHPTGVWVLWKEKLETKMMIWFGYFKPLEKCHKGPHWKACWNKWQDSASHLQIWANPSHPLVASETVLDPNLQNLAFQNSRQCISSYLCWFVFCGAYEKLNQAIVIIYSCKLLISEMLMLQAVVTVSIKASWSIVFLTGSCPIFWPCSLPEKGMMSCDWQIILACVYMIICIHFRNFRENAMLNIDFKQEKAMLSFNHKHLSSYG